MEKSKIYRLAQGAVVNSDLCTATKLEILRVLMHDEDVALFIEKTEKEKKNAETV